MHVRRNLPVFLPVESLLSILMRGWILFKFLKKKKKIKKVDISLALLDQRSRKSVVVRRDD